MFPAAVRVGCPQFPRVPTGVRVGARGSPRGKVRQLAPSAVRAPDNDINRYLGVVYRKGL